MRSKAKWLWLTGLMALLVVPSLGCGLVETLITPARLSSGQAIAIIQISGVPYIDDYYQETVGEEAFQESGGIGYVTPTGQWVANYDGKSIWIVQGAVITNSWGDCLTTWTLSEADSEIQLIGFDCD